MPEEVKEAKKFTKALFLETLNKLMTMTREELEKHVRSKEATSLDLIVAGQIMAAAKGKTQPADFLFDRSTLGPVVKKHELEGKFSAEVVTINIMDNGKSAKPTS